MDIVRHCRLVGAGRPRRHVRRDPAPDPEWLRFLASQRVRIVRLDAIPYVIKKPGTSCFMVEPEIYEFMAWMAERGCVLRADRPARGARHVRHPSIVSRTMACGRTTSCSPDSVLHAFERATRRASATTCRPCRIGSSRPSIAMTGSRSARTSTGSSRRARCVAMATLVRAARRERQPHPVSTPRWRGRRPSAELHLLLRARADDDRYLAARAIQLFARGVPQIYYVGLLAGANDEWRSPDRRRAGDQSARLHPRRDRPQRSTDLSCGGCSS